MADPTVLVPLLVAAAGLGLTGFVVLALALLPEARTPAVAALTVGLAALSLGAAFGVAMEDDGAAGLRLLALANVVDALVAPAFLLHLRWATGAATPGRLPRRHAVLPAVAAAVAAAAVLVDLRPLDRLLFDPAPPVAAVAVAVAVVLVAFTVTGVQGATLVIAHRLVAALPADEPRRRWVRSLIAWLTGLFLFSLAALAAGLAGILDERTARLADIPPVLVLYALVLGALVHRDLFRRVAETALPEKYARSALDDDRVDDLVARARRALEAGRLYAEPTLSLGRLAAAAGVRPNDLSQALNRAGTGYADLVSARRIAEACRLLADPAEADRSILDIAVSVGFNAKSTFNAAFVRHAGTTPSAFRAARLSEAPPPSA